MANLYEVPDPPDDGIDVGAALAALTADDRTELDGTLGVRALLLRLRYLDADIIRTQRLMTAVTHPYTTRIERLQGETVSIRDSLRAYLLTTKGGKVAIPDAGTAYLTSQKAKLSVTDEAALLAWWEKDAGREVPMTEPKPDVSAIKAQLAADLAETGEVPPDGAGVTVTAASKAIAVRLA